MDVPWLGTLTLPLASTPYQLSALLWAKDPTLVDIRRAQFLLIQADESLASGNLYVGNHNVSSLEYGTWLVALQSLAYPSLDSNLIAFQSIWLLADADSVDVHVNFIVR